MYSKKKAILCKNFMTKKHIKKKKSCYFRIFLKIITNNIKSARKVFSEHINLKILFSN